MQINSITTENFRLLEPQSVSFAPGVNVITGANAQGKTTLLECVYLLTGLKSFRTRFDKELIAFDRDYARVTGEVSAFDREQKIELLFRAGHTRQVRQNGVKKTSAELSDTVKAVLFSPDDLNLVRGAASLRRKMLDAAISQLRPGYATALADFTRLYENKTRILRDRLEKPSLLEPLDEFSWSMAQLSARLIRYRAAFIRRLSETAAPIHREFSGGNEELSLAYHTVSTVSDTAAGEKQIFEEIWQRQCALRQAELDTAQCLVGAHKDDLLISVNGTDAKTFASQGQTRTAALSLKLAERDIFLQETGETPILLLDDVLSELDSVRQSFVLNRIGTGQTLITCCDAENVSRLTGGRVLTMEKGRVTENVPASGR